MLGENAIPSITIIFIPLSEEIQLLAKQIQVINA